MAEASVPSVPLIPLRAEKIRRILVCQLRQIGDVLLTTPSIELLARRFPQAEIHVFTEKKCLPVLQGNPHIHTLWPVDKKVQATPWAQLGFYRQVTKEPFDLVVDFQQLPRCRWVTLLSGAPLRLSFPAPWYNRFLYTHTTPSRPSYAAAYKAGALAPLGIAWNGEAPRLYLSAEEKAEGRALLEARGLGGVFSGDMTLVTVDASHRHITRRWPAKHFAALMDSLAELRPDIRFFLSWGPGEEKDLRELHALCRHKDRAVVADTLLSIRQMAACMSFASLHVGNCSAPRHMAVALDVPTLTILGATSTGWTMPSPMHRDIRAKEFMDMPCQACNRNKCPSGLACLETLTPDMVLPRALELLDFKGGAASEQASV